jgi:hypothetical protein
MRWPGGSAVLIPAAPLAALAAADISRAIWMQFFVPA